jgi:hypothetical protein
MACLARSVRGSVGSHGLSKQPLSCACSTTHMPLTICRCHLPIAWKSQQGPGQDYMTFGSMIAGNSALPDEMLTPMGYCCTCQASGLGAPIA